MEAAEAATSVFDGPGRARIVQLQSTSAATFSEALEGEIEEPVRLPTAEAVVPISFKAEVEVLQDTLRIGKHILAFECILQENKQEIKGSVS